MEFSRIRKYFIGQVATLRLPLYKAELVPVFPDVSVGSLVTGGIMSGNLDRRHYISALIPYTGDKTDQGEEQNQHDQAQPQTGTIHEDFF